MIIMPIEFNNNIFHIYNDSISYCIELSKYKDLLHIYYGKRIDSNNIYILKRDRASFSAYEGKDYKYSLDVLPQEYPMFGAQDMRSPALEFEYEDGRYDMCNMRYKSHKIIQGKPDIEGLPHIYENSSGEFTTLIITVGDDISGVSVELYYSISETMPIICRHSRVLSGKTAVYLTNAASASIDFSDSDFKYMHLHGAWIREKHIETAEVKKGFQGIESRRGASSPNENPFMAIMRKDAGEDFGEVYGFSLVYSGNFKMLLEAETYGTMRFQAGVNPHNFKWKLNKGEQFITPELVMVYSENGLGEMSRTFHRLYRRNLCRGIWRDKVRPILINNWEATYFDFNEDKLINICKKASELGIELFVLDDGWFGKRNNDKSSLGDWFVNTDKLPGSLKGLSEKVDKLGMSFGLWVEPEMISEDSDLFRKHPDWALRIQGREMHEGRNQYVLDMGRDDVVAYLTDVFTAVLGSADIKYIKWDMNRYITECYSNEKSPEEQGKVYHQYILGVYRLYERLIEKFPKILFESCSSGGARFDPGMLYYAPQTWTSDDTDAMERIKIQYGTSYVYPLSSMGAHVSEIPNQQVGRSTPLNTRANVAMFGTFGYELDLNQLTEDEKKCVREQVAFVKKHRLLIQHGTFYRLLSPFKGNESAWMVVSEDKKEALVGYYRLLAQPNEAWKRLYLKGLDAEKQYRIEGKNQIKYGGDELMYTGMVIEKKTLCPSGTDYSSEVFYLQEE